MIERVQRIRQLLIDRKIDGIFISKKANITYITGFDFLAEDEREAFLFITHKKTFVITSALYKDDVKKYVPHFDVLDFFSKGKSFWEFIDEIIQIETTDLSLTKEYVYTLGFESTDITVAEYAKLKKLPTTLAPLTIDSIRDIKTSEEIQKIQMACNIGDIAFTQILKIIKPGMTEKEVAYLLNNFIRQQLAEPSFHTIVAFGKASSIPHHAPTDTKLKRKDIVLLDFGAKVQSYCSDMSRTFFVGTPTSEQAKTYTTVKESQEQAFSMLQTYPFSPAKDVDEVSREYITDHNFPEYPHSLGHSVGIKIHDGFALSPYSDFALTNGMVFSIEPGVYLTNKFGIRIEDIVAIQDATLQLLTKSPRNLIAI